MNSDEYKKLKGLKSIIGKDGFNNLFDYDYDFKLKSLELMIMLRLEFNIDQQKRLN